MLTQKQKVKKFRQYTFYSKILCIIIQIIGFYIYLYEI